MDGAQGNQIPESLNEERSIPNLNPKGDKQEQKKKKKKKKQNQQDRERRERPYYSKLSPPWSEIEENEA